MSDNLPTDQPTIFQVKISFVPGFKSLGLQVVTDLMEEREHLRFTIMCLVVTIILLALLVLACALALGFHFQKRKPKMRTTRPKRRNPVERRESIVSTTTILMDSTDCSDDDDAAAQKPIQPIYLL